LSRVRSQHGNRPREKVTADEDSPWSFLTNGPEQLRVPVPASVQIRAEKAVLHMLSI